MCQAVLKVFDHFHWKKHTFVFHTIKDPGVPVSECFLLLSSVKQILKDVSCFIFKQSSEMTQKLLIKIQVLVRTIKRVIPWFSWFFLLWAYLKLLWIILSYCFLFKKLYFSSSQHSTTSSPSTNTSWIEKSLLRSSNNRVSSVTVRPF